MKKIIRGLALVLILIIAAFLLWAWTPLKTDGKALAALTEPSGYALETGHHQVHFTPSSPNGKEVIFYQGGRVDFRAYAPLCAAMARSGYDVRLLKMPLNLAFFNANRALKEFKTQEGNSPVILAGHSLGGVAACLCLNKSPESFSGLLLLASYPPESADLSRWTGKVLSLAGSQDGLATEEKIRSASSRLPPSAEFLYLEGGNHSQFGDYGLQKGDGTSSVTAEEQIRWVIEAMNRTFNE